jgi:hypothetical protein
MKKVLITMTILALANLAMASDGDDLTSLSYISYLERYATVLPATQEESIEAVVNMPLAAGDRVDTARECRMEVVLADGNTLWLDEYTSLSLDAVAFSRDVESERTVLFLADGSLVVEIAEHRLSGNPLRIDSRAATVYLSEPGLYRLAALAAGGLRVEVRAGLAEAATIGGGVLVRAESAAEVGGGEVLRSEQVLSAPDDFGSWVDARRQIAAGVSGQHVDLRYSRQAAQLDNYGSWVYVDSINSWAWQPTVGGDWRPYTAGRWYWTPTGYAWLSYEPWGWLPYHYGSWYFDGGFGWVWSWGGYWGPAWVSWMWWPGYVGWCPYGYYNSWYWDYYGGYYPPYYPHHPGGGGGGASRPPRGDVSPPPRTASGRIGAESVSTKPGAEPALDLNGRVRLAEIDRRGWTVVPQDDFTSPQLSRLARSGERMIPAAGEQTAVIMTKPLATRAPALSSQPAEIERVFRGVQAASPNDLSPLLARDATLSPERARQIARPTTLGELSSRPAGDTVGLRSVGATRLSTSGRSPFAAGAAGQPRTAVPNFHRPAGTAALGAGTSPSRVLSGVGGGAVGSGTRQLVVPQTGTSRLGSSRPVIVPPTGSSIQGGSSRYLPSGGASAPRPSAVGPAPPTVRSSPSSGGGSSLRSSPGRVSAPSSRGAATRGSAGASRPSGNTSGGSGGAAKR